jgi:hypothetical protein
MPYLKLEGFSGISPRTGPALLQPNQAQYANNVKLQSGELRPWRRPLAVYTPGHASPETIYRLSGASASVWLEWTSQVDVVPSPVADVSDYRVYYTDGVKPKKTNWNLATDNGTGTRPFPIKSLNMGVPGPAAAPTLSASQPLTGINILTSGTGYNSTPTVAFSSGTAAATAVINGEVTTITITSGGTGYTSAPAVSISGANGAGATATATITGGVVTSVTVTNKGSGYTSSPAVTFSGGGATTQATGVSVISGKVVAINLTSAGTYGATAPTVTLSGGGASAVQATAEAVFTPLETRSYVYTYISTFGSVLEESAPSPAATVTCSTAGATITINGFSTAPVAADGYNITAVRIYRSVTSAANATYLYVGTVSVNPTTGAAAGSFWDTLGAASLGVALPSLTYSPPPDTLKGLIAMPNGILAGFTDNQVWFSEPYLPHAWPVAYMMTVGSQIVGLGVFGQTLVVCTTQNPYLITGSQPGAMSQEKLPLPEPCISKRSITSDQFGVLYASPNGLVSIAPGTQDVISRQLFTRDEWQTYNPSSLVGAVYQNMYLAFYQAGADKSALVLMRGDTPPLVTFDVAAQAIFVEKATSNVFFVNPTDGKIYQLDADPVNNLFYEWRSKKFTLSEPTNFAAAKAQASWEALDDAAVFNAIVAQLIADNQAIWASGVSLQSVIAEQLLSTIHLNGSILANIPQLAAAINLQFQLFADDVLVYSTSIIDPQPMRLPASAKGYVWEILLTGNAPLRAFSMATTIGELRQV